MEPLLDSIVAISRSPYYACSRIYYNNIWHRFLFKNLILPNGLKNYSQCCYFNSLLQALASIPEIIHLLRFLNKIAQHIEFTKIKDLKNIRGLQFASALFEIIDYINRDMPPSLLSKFIESRELNVSKNQLSPADREDILISQTVSQENDNTAKLISMLQLNRQQDAHETLLYLISSLSNTLKIYGNKNKFSEIIHSSLSLPNLPNLSTLITTKRIKLETIMNWVHSPRLELMLNNVIEQRTRIELEKIENQGSKLRELDNHDLYSWDILTKWSTTLKERSANIHSYMENSMFDEANFSFNPPISPFESDLEGVILNWTKCINCNYLTFTMPNNFSTLEVPVCSYKPEINEGYILTSLIEQSLKPEIVKNIICENCTFKRYLEYLHELKAYFEKFFNSICSFSKLKIRELNLDQSEDKHNSYITISKANQILFTQHLITKNKLEKTSQIYNMLLDNYENLLHNLKSGKMHYNQIETLLNLSDKLKSILNQHSTQSWEVKTKKMKFSRIIKFPSVLTIHLLRNFYDSEGYLKKFQSHIGFTESLDLSLIKFSMEYLENQELQDKSLSDATYNLCSVIEHIGSSDSGHYVCYRRWDENNCNFSQSQMTSIMCLYNQIEVFTNSTLHQGRIMNSYETPFTQFLDHNYQYRYILTSDEIIKRVTVFNTLGCSAYLLFYQRVV